MNTVCKCESICFASADREICVHFTKYIDIFNYWNQAELNRGSIHQSNLSVNADPFPSVIPVNNVEPHMENKGRESSTYRLESHIHQV